MKVSHSLINKSSGKFIFVVSCMCTTTAGCYVDWDQEYWNSFLCGHVVRPGPIIGLSIRGLDFCCYFYYFFFLVIFSPHILIS